MSSTEQSCHRGERFPTREQAEAHCGRVVECVMSDATHSVFVCGTPQDDHTQYVHNPVRSSNYGRILNRP